MAYRTLHELASLLPGRVLVHGSFAPAADGAPTDVKGEGFSVVRTSEGLFTITFDDKYVDLECFWPTLGLAAGADQIAQKGVWTSAARTHTVRVWDMTTDAVADVAADADNRIDFVAIFRNVGFR